ncbi:MAG: hypothetical protein K2K14_04070 [Ruminococcus sp.]|nr:hypothetical protein [Ruminococcus sp.]
MMNPEKNVIFCILPALNIILSAQPSKTVVLIVVLVLFTLTFIISAVVTHKICKKKLSKKSRRNFQDKNSE